MSSGVAAVIAACYSKACAPPPIGSGGSSDAGGSGDSSYRGGHTAPNREEPNASISDIGQVMPDVLEHPEWYSHATDLPTRAQSRKAQQETLDAFRRAAGDPDAMITVYRAVPKGVEEMQPGDWVTVSETYAQHHGETNVGDGYKVVSRQIRAGDLWSSGDSMYEQGWDPSVPFSKYGLTYDPEGAATVAHVRQKDAAGDIKWSRIPVTTVSSDRLASIKANEEMVRSPEDIERVVAGPDGIVSNGDEEDLRKRYVAKLYEAPNGDLHIVDGHHRVAMYAGLGEPLPARIYRDPTTTASGALTVIAACYDRACAPPPVGAGGSSPTSSSLMGGKRATPKTLAAALLKAVKRGRVVSVKSHELHSVLDEIANDKSRLLDLGKIHVQGTRLFARIRGKTDRSAMPQIPDNLRDSFVGELRKSGVKVADDSVDPKTLNPAQSNLAGPKVGQLVRMLRRDGSLPGEPIFISNDGFILDGHHRWAAAAIVSVDTPGIRIPVTRVDLPIKELLKVGLDFGSRNGVESRTLADVAADKRGAG